MKSFVRVKAVLLCLCVCLGISLLFSCKTAPEPAPAAGEEAEAQAEEPKTEGGSDYVELRPAPKARDELTVAFAKGEVEWDFRKSCLASEAQIYTAIYEGLFSYHPFTMEPVPGAAWKWEISEDKKQWTFFIRDNAKFENGDPLLAENFRTAWLSLLEPGQDAPYSSLFDIIEGAQDYRLGKKSANEVGITCPDTKTLAVRLVSPAAFFPSMLCHHSFSPIHPSMLKKAAWDKPVSNGPFYITEISDSRITMVKNNQYWDAAKIDLNKLIILFPEDGDGAAALWNSGEARWLHGDVNLEALSDRSGLEVNAMFATNYYYISSARKPWNDYRLRRALSLVLPWDKIRSGYLLPAKTLIFPIPDYPELEGLDTNNVPEAERLMAEAGYPLGMGLPEIVIRITPSREAARIAAIMAEAWYSTLGIKARADEAPYRSYYQTLRQDDYDVASITWIGDFADPYSFLQMWRRDSNLNDARHNDDDYEALMERSMTEEGAERWKTLAEAEKLLLDRGNVLPIAYSPAVNIIDLDEIDGWFPNVLDIHPFKYMSYTTKKPIPGLVMKSPGYFEVPVKAPVGP